MARAPRLKVFCTPVGFHDALVAAPSQKAALKAWGTTTDLFAAGRASLVEDPALQELALARPGEVVKRPRGNAHALIEAMEADEAREGEGQPKKRAAAKAPPVARGRPEPDRSALDAAERELASAEEELRAGLEGIERRRAALDEEEEALRDRLGRHMEQIGRRRDKLAAAYRRAAQPRRR